MSGKEVIIRCGKCWSWLDERGEEIELNKFGRKMALILVINRVQKLFISSSKGLLKQNK